MGAEESKQYRELYAPSVTDPAQIQTYLYLSGENIAKDPVILQKTGITHILNLSRNIIVNSNGQNIIRKNITIDDRATENIRQHFEEAFKFIDDARARNGRVLVHCAMGISRSTTIVLAYMMLRYRMSLDATYAYVKSRRPIIRPNPGFMDQLREFDNDLRRNNVYKNSNFVQSLPLLQPPRDKDSFNRGETPNNASRTPAPMPPRPQPYQNAEPNNFNSNNNSNPSPNQFSNQNSNFSNQQQPYNPPLSPQQSYQAPQHHTYNQNRHQHHQHMHHPYTYSPYANHYANNPYVNRRYSYPYSY